MVPLLFEVKFGIDENIDSQEKNIDDVYWLPIEWKGSDPNEFYPTFKGYNRKILCWTIINETIEN